MNYMDQVAKMLGVELGEEFEIEGTSDKYALSVTGFYSATRNIDVNASLYHLISGIYKIKRKPFKPKCGDEYFIPEFSVDECCDDMCWTNDTYDKHYYERGLVFRTKEEAVEAAKKMLKSLE